MCGKKGHLAKNYRYRKTSEDGQPNKKVVNVTIGSGNEAKPSGYGKHPIVFSVLQSTEVWVDTGANIH